MKGRGNGQDCTDLQSEAGPARLGGECINGSLCDGGGCECVNLSPMLNIQSDSFMSCKEQQQHRHVLTSSQVALAASKKSGGERRVGTLPTSGFLLFLHCPLVCGITACEHSLLVNSFRGMFICAPIYELLQQFSCAKFRKKKKKALRVFKIYFLF